MATYSYRCRRGHEHEETQRSIYDEISFCPECGEPAYRMVSAAKLVKMDGVNPSIRKQGEGTAPYCRG